MKTRDQVPASALVQSRRPPVLIPAAKPLFIADWLGALFLHFEIEARRLQRFIPFELDLWEGRAVISLVAFTMRGMRLAPLGKFGAWLCRPIATHPFLNCRTYVRHEGEAGICFLTEWLTNRLSVLCGPALYSLPYRHAAIEYCRDGLELRGVVKGHEGQFVYEGELENESFEECAEDSFDQFLLERYAAFNAGHSIGCRFNSARRLFRVRHEPWRQVRAMVGVRDDTLVRRTMPWWLEARMVGANYSPGVRDVWMSAPRRVI